MFFYFCYVTNRKIPLNANKRGMHNLITFYTQFPCGTKNY